MKRAISIFIIAVLLVLLAACGTAKEPTVAVISPEDYDTLTERHMSSLLVGMIIAQAWQDANEVESERFMYYYAAALYQSGDRGVFDKWEDGFIPADELESMIQRHFDVTTEHLRSNRYYSAERNAYEFGGLGSTTDCKITSAVKTGKLLTIKYDIYGPMDYLIAYGTLEMEQDGEDFGSEDFKYLSNQFEWSAQRHLAFLSAMGETDKYGVFMMDSGGRSSTSSDGENWKHYNGQDLANIIAYYENEALPALEAQGSADTGKYEDGWYWSGTYRDGKPLTIDVQRRFGADTYIITALYDVKSNPDIADNMRRREFMQPPDLNRFPELYSAYLWKPYLSGVLADSWSVSETVQGSSLVAFYALSMNDDENNETKTIFPADDVESYVQRYFDIGTDTMRGWDVYDKDNNAYTYHSTDMTAVCNIVSATSYGSKDEDETTKIMIAYEVTPSDEDDTVLWSGELTIELSRSGYKYISNNKYESGSLIESASKSQESPEEISFYDFVPGPGDDKYYLEVVDNKEVIVEIVRERVEEYRNGTPPDNPNHHPPYPSDFPPVSELREVQSAEDFAIRFAGNPDALESVYIAVPIGDNGEYELHMTVSLADIDGQIQWGSGNTFFKRVSEIKWHEQDIELYHNG